MKTIYAIQSVFFSFFLISILLVSTIESSAKGITIDNESKMLVASAGCTYQWFKNGEILPEGTDKELGNIESGHYAVEVTDEVGSVTRQEATVAVTAAGAIIKIYIIGDSTVMTYSAADYPQTGWGQMLAAFFNSANITIDNHAIGGRSSRSFFQEGRWTPIKTAMVTGDYVFIQFGHNDQAVEYPDRYTSIPDYKSYLTTYCNDAKAKGAIPVLVSPMVRNYWSGTTMRNVFTEAGNDYRGAMLEVATTLNVAFIDLNMKSWNLYKTYGQNYLTRFLFKTFLPGEYPNYPAGEGDKTHFQEMGSIGHCRMITEGIKELSARADMANLIKNLKPLYTIGISVNPATGSDSMTTKTGTYPSGVTVTLKTIPKTGKTFQKWNNATGTQISTVTLSTVTSGTAATSYAAIYKGAVLCTATVTTSGATVLCQGESVTLTANSGSSFIWKNGGTQVGTAATYKATTAGAYTVEVTQSNACKATSVATNVTVSTLSTWYADTDNDGKGDPNTSKSACVQPTGYVADKTDLCPTDVNKIDPGQCGCGIVETACLDCNGVKNGTALIDNCSRCAGGNTGKTACTSVGEAETDACAFDGITETKNAGYKGASYLNVDNAIGTAITFNVLSSNAGTATLSFRYANGGTADRPAQINVNGTILLNTVAFSPTGTFTDWNVVDIPMSLVQGSNVVKLVSSTADGLANIDQIGYVSSGLSKGGCVITGLDDSKVTQAISIYPNPSKSTFQINISIPETIQVIDLEGRIYEEHKNVSNIEFGGNLKAGIYFLKIENKVYKLIKE